jgi:hypothetical protein
MLARLKECSDLREILWQEMEPNKNEHQAGMIKTWSDVITNLLVWLSDTLERNS